MATCLRSALCLGFVVGGAAHLPYWEPEFARTTNFRSQSRAGFKPSEDLSFEKPFDILRAFALPQQGGPPLVRELAAGFVNSLLRGDDVDYYLYNKTSTTSVPFVGYPIVPACRAYQCFFPTVALLGPLGTRDSATGQLLFSEVGGVPFHVPEGYGALIVRHQFLPVRKLRPSYWEPFSQSKWFLPSGYTAECIEQWDDPACDRTNVIAAQIDTPGEYYWVMYDESGPHEHATAESCGPGEECDQSTLLSMRSLKAHESRAEQGLAHMKDAAFVVGTVDDYTPFDFARA